MMIRIFNLESFFVGNNVREKLISLIYDTVTLIWMHKGGINVIVLSNICLIFLLEEFRREKNICREYMCIFETQWFYQLYCE